MDNASKALIMAGAILISVAIVGIGIYIFSAANSMTNEAVNSMEDTQISMFNNNFFRYANDGDTITGSRAKELKRYCDTKKVKVNGDPSTSNKYQIKYHYDEVGYINGVGIGTDAPSES